MNDTITVDVEKLADVLASTDRYCSSCQTDIAEQMQELDPTRDWFKLVCVEADDRYRAGRFG